MVYTKLDANIHENSHNKLVLLVPKGLSAAAAASPMHSRQMYDGFFKFQKRRTNQQNNGPYTIVINVTCTHVTQGHMNSEFHDRQSMDKHGTNCAAEFCHPGIHTLIKLITLARFWIIRVSAIQLET